MSNQCQIKYTLSIENPHTHTIDVKIEMNGQGVNNLDLIMPIWTPGHYYVREFSQNIIQLKAYTKNEDVPSEKTSKNVWHIDNIDGEKLTIEYQVYAFEKTVRTSYVDIDHAMINAASVFIIPKGYENQPLDIQLEPYHEWKRITTTLESYKGSHDRFIAKDLDDLIDSPIEMGNHQLHSFVSQHATHEYAITSPGTIDTETLMKDTKTIVEEIQKMFGDTPPYDYYVFFLHLTDNSYGGLEHCNSCAMIFDRNGFFDRKKYIKLLALTSHEFFHTWNVKRIRPQELGPFNYYEEVYTKLLWIAEGVTSYYDNLFLPRCGVINVEEYFELIGNDLALYDKIPGKSVMTVEEASFNAWVKLYRQNENSSNTTISYYLAGGIIMMALDLTIRKLTMGEKSLDDVYRQLWEMFKADGKGINKDTFVSLCENTAGESLDEIWNYLSTPTPVKLDKYLEPFGIEIINEYSKPEYNHASWFGIFITPKTSTVFKVMAGSPSYEAGLYAKDEILAINGMRVNNYNTIDRLNACNLGEPTEVLVSRDGMIKTITMIGKQRPLDKFKLKRIENPTDSQKSMFTQWLKCEWDA